MAGMNRKNPFVPRANPVRGAGSGSFSGQVSHMSSGLNASRNAFSGRTLGGTRVRRPRNDFRQRQQAFMQRVANLYGQRSPARPAKFSNNRLVQRNMPVPRPAPFQTRVAAAQALNRARNVFAGRSLGGSHMPRRRNAEARRRQMFAQRAATLPQQVNTRPARPVVNRTANAFNRGVQSMNRRNTRRQDPRRYATRYNVFKRGG